MRKRRKILILLASALIILLVIALIPRDRGPVYKGRSLEEWLSTVPLTAALKEDFEQKEEFAEAIHAMGTNSLPYLVKWIAYEEDDSKSRVFVKLLMSKAPILQRITALQDWVASDDRFAIANSTVHAFEVLGPSAIPAIQELERLVNESDDEGYARARVVCVLAQIGPASIPTMLRLFESKNWNVRFFAILFIEEVGTNAQFAIPKLLKLTNDSSQIVATIATRTLESIQGSNAIPSTIQTNR